MYHNYCLDIIQQISILNCIDNFNSWNTQLSGSVINSNYGTSVTPYQNATLTKLGRLVLCEFKGVDAYTFKEETQFIGDEYDLYRPIASVTGIVYIYKADSNAYLGTVDVKTNGKMYAMYQNAIGSRNYIGNTGHKIYGTMCWYSKV